MSFHVAKCCLAMTAPWEQPGSTRNTLGSARLHLQGHSTSHLSKVRSQRPEPNLSTSPATLSRAYRTHRGPHPEQTGTRPSDRELLPLTQDSTVTSSEKETLLHTTAQCSLKQAPRRTNPLTCCAALSASSANSTDRPFSACLRDPHVLLFRVAQEGSGVVSDPKALRRKETHRGRDTQAWKLGGQPTRRPPLPNSTPPQGGRPAHLPTETPAT